MSDALRIFGNLPIGRRLEKPERPANYAGTMRTLPRADEESIRFARRHWRQASEHDFAREGKAWIDRASGLAYKRVRSNPLLAADPKATGVSTFLVADDAMIFLKADEPDPVAERRVLGEVGARAAAGPEPLGEVVSGTEIF
jgi:hypothetical protein